jgi:hypothetical protein
MADFAVLSKRPQLMIFELLFRCLSQVTKNPMVCDFELFVGRHAHPENLQKFVIYSRVYIHFNMYTL